MAGTWSGIETTHCRGQRRTAEGVGEIEFRITNVEFCRLQAADPTLQLK